MHIRIKTWFDGLQIEDYEPRYTLCTRLYTFLLQDGITAAESEGNNRSSG